MHTSGNLICVTGGTGFIGRSVLKQLVARTYRVRALTRKAQTSKDIDWLQGTLENSEALKKLTQDADTLIHIAGLTKARSLQTLLSVNKDGARNAAKAALEAGARRFILVSSIAASQPHLSNYARSKRAGEDAVREIFKAEANNTTELVIIRPPAIIGPGDEATKPMLDILQRGFLPAPSGHALKTGRMSFVYMDDLARFLIETIDAPFEHDVLTPHGATLASSWADLAMTASKVLSKPVRVIPVFPLVLKIAAFTTQIIAGLFRKSVFFNIGKVQELLHTNWTGDTEISKAYTLEQALRLTFEMDSE